MKHLFLILILSASSLAQAKIEVLFHPHDPTLEKIGQWIREAHQEINIAMYNMETTAKSPVIQAFKSTEVQKRIQSGELKARLIFEGYGTPEENNQKMQQLEDLGIDVRYLGKAVKIHHKFGVLDPHEKSARVVTGSANWSLSSFKNYNENILFLTGEPEATARYYGEFIQLWNEAQEFGSKGEEVESVQNLSAKNQPDLEVFFNSLKDTVLTDQVVRLIDQAQSEIQIATTRIRLKPILEAVKNAAERGVRVQIVISQDDYQDLGRRVSWLNHKNIELRVKFYNLKVAEYMTYQMHNKFMIVDHEAILTGSFNWSASSENNHIENIIELHGSKAKEVLKNYESEFASIWNMGRSNLDSFQSQLAESQISGELPACAFNPTTLKLSEIKKILKENSRCKP